MSSPEALARPAGRYPTVMPVWRDLPPPTLSAVDVCRLVGGSTLLETDEWWLVGIDPVTTLHLHGGELSWTDGPICPVPEHGTLLPTLRAVLDQLQAPAVPGVGAICVLGGDAFRDRRGDAVVVFPSVMIRCEPDRLRLVALARVAPHRTMREVYADAASRLDELAARLAATPGEPVGPPRLPDPSFDSELPDDAYRDLIEAAHRRVAGGEARQVTISRRFAAPTVADPLAVYRVLRASNRSPYHFLLRLPGLTLVGASPQGLVKVRDREVAMPVIAGTRRRGADPAADAALAAELLADPKERDEHAMLVELAEADLAGVAEPGSIRVAGPEVRRYARVMHLVSDVAGTLAPHRTGLDALAAVFPAGTVAGTPREAALRIIDELEPHPRGLYGGGIGLLGFAGELELGLGIRTLQFRDGMAYCQAGAGVVAGSVPDREVRESRDKASALFAAVEAAGKP